MTNRAAAILGALSFPCFCAFTVYTGQLSALACIAFALFVRLREKHPLLAGCVISILLYKPPMLILVSAMVLVAGNLTMVSGLGLGLSGWFAVSAVATTPDTILRWIHALRTFGAVAVEPARLEWAAKFIDLHHFFGRLFHPTIANCLVLLITAAVLCRLAPAWRTQRDARLVLSATITWNLLLNIYSPDYDGSLLAIAALIAWPVLEKYPLFRYTLVALYFTSFVAIPVTRATGLQPISVAAAAFGTLQLLAFRDVPLKIFSPREAITRRAVS